MAASKKKTVKKVPKSKTKKRAVKSRPKKSKQKRVIKKVSKKKVVKKAKKVARRVVRKKAGPRKYKKVLALKRAPVNPIISPSDLHWEREAVFNPAAVVHNDRVHLFYRALGPDGLSRVGYASSKDGVHFDKRHSYPVYVMSTGDLSTDHHPYTSPVRSYDQVLYVSGGGWGGCEDPRTVKIGERVYMTFNVFNGWYNIRVAMTSIDEKDLERGEWKWRPLMYLSPANERHKNWVLFPEKINGKFALLHNLHNIDPHTVCIEYVDDIEKPIMNKFKSHDPHLVPDRDISWHNRMRSVGPPPVKTEYGWLVFYHAMDKYDPNRYKLGVILLDKNDPTKVLYRSTEPILEPDEWYENDWKPGIIYASGTAVMGENLYVYYGGGDKHVGVASVNLKDFITKLMRNEHLTLRKIPVKVK
jgi:beta-1,2-mannobiose phosphorylase / 1,2-beta-oligomannan phosphorylase